MIGAFYQLRARALASRAGETRPPLLHARSPHPEALSPEVHCAHHPRRPRRRAVAAADGSRRAERSRCWRPNGATASRTAAAGDPSHYLKSDTSSLVGTAAGVASICEPDLAFDIHAARARVRPRTPARAPGTIPPARVVVAREQSEGLGGRHTQPPDRSRVLPGGDVHSEQLRPEASPVTCSGNWVLPGREP
jgi:hypothetical protein